MRVLCVGLDGADFDLVQELRGQGKLPTIDRLAGRGTFGPLRSTIPAATPTAWSSFLTGLNPGGHGIFNFSTNPNRSLERVESAASRGGAPFWRALGAAGHRSAFVTVPFTFPPEPLDGVLVSGYGGPIEPAILPAAARELILERHPDLVTAHHPMKERWWENFDGFTQKLLDHVEQTTDVCKLAMELEPDLSLLCVDFMSADFAGHLGWHRLDSNHPAHRPEESGDELVRVYQAVDAACGELAEEAERRYGEEPTVLVLSDHGMKPTYWTFHLNRWLEEAGLLRYRRRSLQRLRRTRLDYLAKVDQRLVRTRKPYGRAFDRLPLPRAPEDRLFADVDFGSTRAYAFGYGGQLFLGEASGALGDAGFERELVAGLEGVRHPESGEPAFEVHRKADLYHGPFVHKAPDLVLLPRDERLHVDASRWAWERPFDRHDHLDPAHAYGYSGHHGLRGILAAAGPGIAEAPLPDGAEITQLPATLLALLGVDANLDGAPLEAILDRSGSRETVTVAATAASEESVYGEDEEAAMLERLRDLGYE